MTFLKNVIKWTNLTSDYIKGLRVNADVTLCDLCVCFRLCILLTVVLRLMTSQC